MQNNWFIAFPKKANAKLRLFCFAYAGGSPNMFREWHKHLPEHIEVVALVLPGHYSRLAEPCITEWSTLLLSVQQAILGQMDVPYILFGHSFGARLAFELVKLLQDGGHPLPRQLLLAGCHAPNLSASKPWIHNLPDAQFLEQVRNMRGTPAEFFEDSEILSLLTPVLRADIGLAETWSPAQDKTVRVPIVAFGGLKDEVDPVTYMQDWHLYSESSFKFHLLPGAHFFIHENQEELLQLISSSITQESKTIHELFEQQAAINPGKTALVWMDQEYNYTTLNSQANKLARYLVELGVRENTYVGICATRSVHMIIGLLAILKAGAAYLPLDSEYPPERLNYMVKDANVGIILTEDCLKIKLDFANTVQLVAIDSYNLTISQLNDTNLKLPIQSRNLAYVNYTSGSTGQPKGVEVMHRGVVSLIMNATYAQLDENQIFLQLATISFDAATFEIWGPLLLGAKCVLFDTKFSTLLRLQDFLVKYKISTLFLTTALFNTIIDECPSILQSVKQLLTGGEAHSVRQMRRAIQALPNTKIISMYGPTEATTFATYHPVITIDTDAKSIPIGQPIANTQVHVFDGNQQPVDNGSIGELYIGGIGVARGYLNQPELTKNKFINGLYKTGDLVKFNIDSNLEFIGRIDNQVKINGFRIELEEVESSLLKLLNIKQVAVIVRQKPDHEKSLVAYLVANEHQLPLSQLRKILHGKLPKYMIPGQFFWLDNLPLTATNKIDRKSLAILES